MIKILIRIIGLAILTGISILAYNKVYDLTSTKLKQELRLKEEKELSKKKQLLEEKLLINRLIKIKKPYLDELMRIQQKHHLEINTLLCLANLSTKFDLKPDEIMGLLLLVDIKHPHKTRQRVTRIISREEERLYWLKLSQKEHQFREKERLITKCQIQLALTEIISKNEKIKEELQVVQSNLIYERWHKMAKWKGAEGGGH